MIENLRLVATESFDGIPYDFYKNVNNEYLMTREQIGTALGYKNPANAIKNIHLKHPERLNKFSAVLTSRLVGAVDMSCVKEYFAHVKALWKSVADLGSLLQPGLWIGLIVVPGKNRKNKLILSMFLRKYLLC